MMSTKRLSSRITCVVALTIGCLLGLYPRPVAASPLFELVGDTGSTGGMQARTVAGGSAAAYFNPALLVDAKAELTVGFIAIAQQLEVTPFARRGGQFDVPAGLENAGHADGSRFDNYAIPTSDLQLGRMMTARKAGFMARPRQDAGSGEGFTSYEMAGIAVKLGEYLAFGLHALIPNGTFTKLRAFFNDEREQYFSNSLHPELYSDRMTALSLALGVGVKLSERVSLGLGATLGLQANVVAPTYVVDTGMLDKILIDMNASVNIGVTPHMGANFKLTDRLRITATAHAPQHVELGTSFTFLLANGVEQSSGVTFVLDYMPWQFAAGGSFDLLKESEHTLTVAGTLRYATWSNYQDRHGVTPSGKYEWSDTLSPSIGLRHGYGRLQSMLDISYVPTPVPQQTGRSNYVDTDRISSALGAEYSFRAWDLNMRAGGQAQLHVLTKRRQTKLATPTSSDGKNIAGDRVKDELPDDAQLSGEPVDGAAGLQTNNPGWPGFSFAGFIVGGTVYLAVAF